MKRFSLLAIILIMGTGVSCRADSGADKYINAVRQYADKVMECGRDTYGPKQTSLFVDGVAVDTLEPPKWKKDGEEWILSNLASQQNLFRTLDGLTSLTGDTKYRGAAVRAIRYAFDNLQNDNGLLYWGGHYAYDALGDKLCRERDSHELKRHYPYYQLMWQVNPEATRQFLNAFWRAHVLNWNNLDMNRHGKYEVKSDTPWPTQYKGGPIFFVSDRNGLSFANSGSDLFYAGAMLYTLGGEEPALVWAKRLAGRYDETRNPKTGLSGYQFSQITQDRAVDQFKDVERLKGHLVLEGTVLTSAARMRYGMMGIVQLRLAEMLGKEGAEFKIWALKDLAAFGKHAYNPADNTFSAMLTDGLKLNGKDFIKKGYYGSPNKPEKLEPWKADGLMLWAYSVAYRSSGVPFMWQMARNIAKGEGLGDIGETPGKPASLKMDAANSDPMDVMACLELSKATKDPAFLSLAEKIGDNILEQRFHKGFFVTSKDRIYAKFDAVEPLVLLNLAAVIEGKEKLVPEVSPGMSYFHCPYDGYGRTRDVDVIYSVTAGKAMPVESEEEE